MSTLNKFTTKTLKKKPSIKVRYEVLGVAQYLMSLDPKRKYFTNSRMKVSETSISVPKVGNIRLNNLLYLCQIFYYLQYKELLFSDELLAFEYGPIVYSVYNNFWNLYCSNSSSTKTNLDIKTRKFLREWFNYFEKYSTQELLAISHEDPAWFSTWQNNEDPRIDFTNPQRLRFYEKYFTNFLNA